MIKHSHTKVGYKSLTYQSWANMKDRCNNPSSTGWKKYGGSGVSYTPVWENFTNFLGDMGERPEGTSLDRIDGSKGYFKENCRWADIYTQNRNMSTNKFITYNGITKTNQQWASEVGLPSATLYNRVFVRGWAVEKALTTPARQKAKVNNV